MKNCLAVCAVALVSLAAIAKPVVVKTENPTWEVVVADDVMEPPAASVDAAPEIQRRAKALVEGGTLFLKAGVYRIASPVAIPANVTLKGDYSKDDPSRSTVLAIYHGRGDEEGEPTFSFDTSSGLQGLWFHYPEQTLANPTPYAWTVKCSKRPTRAPDNQTVRDCTFVNAWRAISIGPEGNELHTLRDVRICALKTGFHVDSTTDIGRIVGVEVSPVVWSASGLAGAPSEADLRAYLLAHDTTGADYGRSDWEYVWRLRVDGYKVGCRFSKGSRGVSNAVMVESSFVRCGTGLEVNELNGVGLAVYDTSFDCLDFSARATERFTTVVQFLACTFKPAAPANGGGKLSHFIVKDGRGVPLRHLPMAWPRPASDRFFLATDYGMSVTNPCNAAALQRALDAAGAAGGGTVYVPGGWYDFRAGVTVPTGVELRGNSATPHHTAAGGSVFMVRFGKGDEGGTPFVRLAAGAGLRGLCVWYPESPVYNPDPYPWAVRSLGENCWLADVNVANAWQGVDFMTHPSAGHRIAYLSGVAWKRMLFVGNSSGRGWVEDTLFNPHYSQRLPPKFPTVLGAQPADFPKPGPGYSVQSCRMRKQLEAHVFRDCADERIRGTFVYAAMDGLSFQGRNRAKVLMHGTDTAARGVEIAQAAGGELSCALVQLTPFETMSGKESAGFHFAPDDAGTSVFRASQLWVNKPTVIAEGKGRALFECANSLSGPVYARSGELRFDAFRFSSAQDEWLVKSGAAKVTAEDSGEFPFPEAALPKEPPLDVTIDCEKTRPLENQVAKRGGLRKAKDCFCRVEDGALRFHADLVDPAYAFYYADIWVGKSPIWPKTRLRYRIKPLSELAARGDGVTFDFLFTDGTVMRESGRMVSHAPQKVGEWRDVSLSLRGFVGKTIERIMIRTDHRGAPGVYDVLFDDIRLVTASGGDGGGAVATR